MSRKKTMNDCAKIDVVVIGAGVAGLCTVVKLARMGIKVALIESNNVAADGPSTRNEGWLHHGTYHAQSIADRATAITVAQRCIAGTEWIKAIAPFAIEPATPSIALLRDSTRRAETEDRWREAGVHAELLTARRVNSLATNVKKGFAYAYRVRDCAVNTPLLYRTILSDAVRMGVKYLPDTRLAFVNPTTASILTSGRRRGTIEATLFVHTTGYKTAEYFESEFGSKVPLRFYKSHLIDMPRLSSANVFYLDPGQAGIMSHETECGWRSTVGLNDDAIRLRRPEFTTVPGRVKECRAAIGRLLSKVPAPRDRQVRACIKVDFDPAVAHSGPGDAARPLWDRSLNVQIYQPKGLQSHIIALPGKMTEAPCLADELTRIVARYVPDRRIANRPYDPATTLEYGADWSMPWTRLATPAARISQGG